MKNFYNNTIMSGALSKALRVLALLCVLLGVSSSAWGETYYLWYGSNDDYNNNSYQWSDGVSFSNNKGTFTINTSYWNCYVYIAKGSKSKSNLLRTPKFANPTTSTGVSSLYQGNRDGYNRIQFNTGTEASKSFTIECDFSNSSEYTFKVNTGSSSGGDSGGGNSGSGDSGNTGNCNSIEIYCHYEASDTHDMNLHMWDNGGSDYTTWPGPEAQTHVEIDGVWYAKWVYESTNQDICLKFTNGKSADNEKYESGNKCGLKSGNKYYFYLPNDWGGKEPTLKKTEAIECGGSGGDDDDDVADCDGNNIEVWCRGVGAYTDMWCYGWNPDNDSQKPFGNFAGCISTDKRMYDGHQWAVWTAEDYDKLSVIFSTGSDQCKTQDMIGLTKGNRYFFVLSDSWHQTSPTMSAIPCGGSGEIVIVNGTVYLDISKLQGWDDAGAVLKVRITDKSDDTEELALTQCPSDANIFYVDEVLNLENIKTVNMLRYDDKGTNLWNQTGDITFNTNTPCVQLTEWNGGYAHYSLTIYNGACGIQSNSPVLLTKDAVVSDDGESVTMYAYLSKTFCEAITEYGFVYCQGSATQGCAPTRSSAKLKVNNGQLYRGQSFELTTSDLANGSTYGYKAYVMVGEMMYISDETGYFRLADCTTRPEAGGDPINITVNAALGEDFIDDCSLTYGSLKTAIDKLRDSYNNEDPYKYVTYYNSQSYNLNQPVNILVHYYDDTPTDNTSAYLYRGTTSVGKYAGNNKPKNANLLENFNRTGANAANILTIKAGTKIAKPLIHHIVLRNSKNIVLDSLYIYSDPNGVGDNAIEMDINVASGGDGWHALNNQTGPGIIDNYLDNANILIKNCVIESDGFTGIHISSYNGVTFKNNDFESKFESGSDNDINYGASAKFLYCKNIKFIENNFRGDHATLMWIQEVKNMLVMNNVFWNTNKYQQKQGTHVPAAMRIVTQWNPTQNIGFYYNTYFFADNGKTWSASKYNFLHFSHTVSGGSGSYNLNTMYFKYNNCYSYDPDCPGDEDINLGEYTSNFCPNNFWSVYDENKNPKPAVSAFAFGCDGNKFVNVQSQVCATTAEGPSSLIVRGTDMNLGSAPTEEELLGFTLTPDEAKGDRYYSNVRPDGVGWTYGAYQSKENEDTDVIYWVGHTDDWDDRNNWEYLTHEDPDDPNSPMIRRTVSCLNNFSNNLKAVIEEIGTREIVGGRKWPLIPSSFDPTTRKNNSKAKVPAGEQVNTTTKFAKTIELEYGAGIKGVEYLGDGTYYDNATVGFTASRSQWILVGTVIMPYDNTLSKYRNIKSGDYFVKDHLPHVYMHKAELDGVNAKWDETFTSLEVEVEPTTVFAIQIPNQYGRFKLPAHLYNKKNKTNYDPSEPITYKNFDGRFVNDTGLPNYTGLTAGQPALLNNSYPACIDAKALEEAIGGTVQYYNYESGTFMNTSATSQAVLLKPQHGFIFTPATDQNSLQIPSSVIVDGNTRSRSAEVTMPTFSLNLQNANTGVAYSNVVLRYDELMDVNIPSATDVEKVFSPNTDAPELYIIANDAKYSRINVGSQTQVIPLGIRLKQDMNVKFEKAYFEGFNNVTLVDTYTGKEIDLLRKSYTTEALVAGDDIEGRFFLNLEIRDPYIDEPDDDVTTSIEENEIATNAINIYVDEDADNTIRVVSNAQLETIYVSDMSGRTSQYNVDGYAANLRLPVTQGVYVVQVIGDNATRTEKVVIK